jgi:hypothetical protein
MKKGLVILVVLLVGLLSFTAYYHWYPNNPGGHGFNFTEEGATNYLEGTVDVQIHQWISAKWVSRATLLADRGMTLGPNEGSGKSGMPSGIDISRYGVYNDIFLGGIGMISNGNLTVKVEKDDDPGPNNVNDVISALKLFSYNTAKGNGWLLFDQGVHPDLWLDSVPTGEGANEVTVLAGIYGNNYGPELAVFSDLNVPWQRAPEGGKFYLDITITPETTFSLFN